MDSYFDPSHAGSFGGVQAFKRHVDGSTKTKDVKTWLQNKDTYTLHKPVRLKFRRRRTFTVGIDDLWKADLADVSSLSKYNDKNKYVLTCLDVFSKHASVVPLKSETGAALTEAFSSLLHGRHLAHFIRIRAHSFSTNNFKPCCAKM